MAKRAIIRSLSKVCDNATTDELFLDTWPSEVNIVWRRISARDYTNSPTRVEVSLKRGNDYYILNAAAQGAAARDVRTAEEFAAPGDFRPGARFWGATSGDVLEIYCYGEIQE